jgi:hypothetical protein
MMTTVMLPSDAVSLVMSPVDLVHQENVEATLGLPQRTYLELLRRRDCSVKIRRAGKLRVVSRVEFLEWFRAQPDAEPANTGSNPPEERGDNLEALSEEFNLGVTPAPSGRRRRG